MNKPTAKHYGVIGSDSVIRAYPADETDAYIAHLEQRAEAAEAKLAELEKQDSIKVLWASYSNEHAKAWRYTVETDIRLNAGDLLFTRPAPAINLAELLPQMLPMDIPFAGHRLRNGGWNDCIETILRNIEEAK